MNKAFIKVLEDSIKVTTPNKTWYVNIDKEFGVTYCVDNVFIDLDCMGYDVETDWGWVIK